MRIVSWNCNGKFREKNRAISDLQADIYVIQECENPKEINYHWDPKFLTNFLWTGENRNKGLGIFFSEKSKIRENPWPKYTLRNFISINIDNKFDLVGVWACKPYIEEYCIYQSVQYNKYNQNTIVIGDFNSNKIWDSQHKTRNHSAVVNLLQEKGLYSAYHIMNRENQGEETRSTFYLHRYPDRGYHTDFCFLDPSRIIDFQLLEESNWLEHSDHIPMLIDIKDN